MLAAALHNYWLRPGGYHDLAVSHIDYLLNLYNCCDPVLKRYPLLYKGSRPMLWVLPACTRGTWGRRLS